MKKSIEKALKLTKKERTKNQLIRAAFRILSTKEAADVAISKFTEEAELANGTFYNYFQSKEELVNSVSLSLAEELVHRIETSFQSSETPTEKLAIGAMVFLKKAHNDRTWASALINIGITKPYISSTLLNFPKRDIQSIIKSNSLSLQSEQALLNSYLAIIFFAIKSIVDGTWKKGDEKEHLLILLRMFKIKESESLKLVDRVCKQVWDKADAG